MPNIGLEDVFEEMAGILLAARSGGYQRQRDLPPGDESTHQSHNLKRNRATIQFYERDYGHWFGRDWLGISGDKTLHQLSDKPIKVIHSENGHVEMSNVLKKKCLLPHHFSPINGEINHCSEGALLNGLYHFLGHNGSLQAIQNHPADLFLITERLPCESCTDLLDQFQSQFPQCHLHLGLFFDYKNLDGTERSVADVRKVLKNNITFYKIDLALQDEPGYLSKNGKQPWGHEIIAKFKPTEHRLHITEILPDADYVRTSPKMLSRIPGQISQHALSQIAMDPNAGISAASPVTQAPSANPPKDK